MLCVTGKNENNFLVFDTDDKVTEEVSKEVLLDIVFNRGIKINGVSEKYIEIARKSSSCNKNIIDDFFMQMKKYSSISDRQMDEQQGIAGVRYWGDWVNPDDAEDEEDYDWKILSSSYSKKLKEIAKILRDKYKDVNISLCVGEKCWVDLTISPIRYIV